MLDPASAAWAVAAVGCERLVSSRALRASGSPWLLTLAAADGTTFDAVLRRGGDVDDVRTERDAAEVAGAAGIPVARVLATRLDDAPLLLIEAVRGSSSIPLRLPVDRLRVTGAVAARIAAVPAPSSFVRRSRPIPGVDFAALRAGEAPHPLLARAERAVAAYVPEPGEGLVHGDLWQGNLLWAGDEVVAVIDWDCAGRGAAGLDLGSLRLDAVTLFGAGADEHVLDGWRAEAGDPADLAYWDAVAALSTPTDMGWFTTATQEQGRPDLDREEIVALRDAFLTRVLDGLEG